MASLPFKVVSWSPNEPITSDKLNTMVSNDNWNRDNMVRGRFESGGVNRDIGVLLLSGLQLITPPGGTAASVTKNVTFGTYFSEACNPIVTTGVVSSSQKKIWVTIDGPGSKTTPTRDGFQVTATVDSKKKKKKFTKNFYISWHALGF